jgi:acetoin utilization protein AcuB
MASSFQRLQGMPPIKALMTPFPHSISADASVKEARRMMEEQAIRHLPVKDGDQLVGVITDREVERALDPRRGSSVERVREIMIEAHVADLLTPAARVLESMVRDRVEVVLVLKEERLAGIFTGTDACAGYADLLRTLFPSGDGEGVA